MYSERVIHKFNPKVKQNSVTNLKDSANKSPDPYYILRGHNSYINSVVFDRWNPNILYSGSGDGELRIWDIQEKKCLESYPMAHRDSRGILSMQSIKLSNGQSHLVTQGRDGTIKLWRCTESQLTLVETLETSSISLAKCSTFVASLGGTNQEGTPDINSSANLLAMASDELPSNVDLWDLNTKEVVVKCKPTNPSLLGVCMSLKLFSNPDSGHLNLLSGYENGSIVLWDIRQPDKLLYTNKIHEEPVLAMDISGNKVVSGGGDTLLCQFSITKSEDQTSNDDSFEILNKYQLPNQGISEIKIRPDKKIIATAGWDHRVRIFNFKKHTPLAILKYHEESVYTIDFNTNNILASASKDMRIALWSIYNDNNTK
ncbi:guanine nucleotide-binding protein subunit beta-like protein 1 [Tieghemostelium lacteum]|uniref:Guanine nucleotide-binding protein subunit beta-like protein 1 n=1 Tax=Tieghemostelium lacteum TaxID=361077 RepID=A0A152A1H6_TIELA|nr:guanine nucleotide-binding protein subunit beta-like protein 1 [Tieghemostelium lacteum]|eukprot:KYR00102.1 guanine nucleotide-binding protein subunit beta-like protein 1 [Tieghemostelium lacteum]